MPFNLAQSLKARRRAQARYYIVIAAKLIAACPCEQRRWRAMHELRKLQAIARGAA
jgi:hypothetical protein